MNGYVKIHRKMLDNPVVMKDNDYLAVWMYLLLNAAHKTTQVMFSGEKVELEVGQLITGRKIISEKLNICESKVQRILKTFESEQQIEQQKSNKNRLITLKKWELYQISEQQNEQQVNNKNEKNEQQNEQQKNNGKWLETLEKQNFKQQSEQQIEQQKTPKVNTNKNIYSTTSTTTYREKENIKEKDGGRNGNERNGYESQVEENEIVGRYGNKRNGEERQSGLVGYCEDLFGRKINRVEKERILSWKDNELTRYAINDAVLHNACNVKYIEKILERYETNNFRSIADITGTENKEIPVEFEELLEYDWLNEREEKNV